MDKTEYKLEWESVAMTKLHLYSNADPMFYKNTKQDVPNSEIPDEDWHPTSKVTDKLEDVEDQYNTLKEWAESDYGFVRNVKLYKRSPSEWEETV